MVCHSQQQLHVKPTEESTLISGAHGRDRRMERKIQKIDLKRAKRYGMKEPARDGNEKYTYGGIVFIYDPKRKREITSYPSYDRCLVDSGTKCAPPVMLAKMIGDSRDIELHEETKDEMLDFPDKWSSHSVLVVDMSGSMRRDDVNGARCRSDGVWMALARDYVQKPLKNKSRSATDLISIISMGEEARPLVLCEPISWVLYNKLVDMREWTSERPHGPGNYMPALKLAEKLLRLNRIGSCALSLLLFSDGKPSDRGDFTEEVGKLASQFGRRLTFCCIGMAEEGENFSTLNDMVTEASEYGVVASFGKPSLDTDSLSNIITSLATSLTTSKTELTDFVTGKSKTVRIDVQREKIGLPDDIHLSDEWWQYKNEFVYSFYMWNYKKDKFLQMFDSRCQSCWKDTEIEGESGKVASSGALLCPTCNGVCFCSYKCYREDRSMSGKGHNCGQTLASIRNGDMAFQRIPSFSVAVKSVVFGEGAERLVRKVRFLDEQSQFVGPKMVAKESRFVGEAESYSTRLDYQNTFARTQAVASQMADKFNEAIDDLAVHFRCKRDWLRKLPRIKFLEPWVVDVYDSKFGEYCFLIEPMLEGKYEKFNNNMGYVQGQRKKGTLDSRQENEVFSVRNEVLELGDNLERLSLNSARHNIASTAGEHTGLAIIEEGQEDDDDISVSSFNWKMSNPVDMVYSNICDNDFPQAFSHFTYEKSKKRFMVVDLQGVFKKNGDGTRCFQLTDPVVHKHRKNNDRFLRWNFGRTDRGEKGMDAFIATHKCSEVCKLLGLSELDKF